MVIGNTQIFLNIMSLVIKLIFSLLRLLLVIFLIYFYFMCKGVLPACVSIYYMPAVPVKAKRGHRIPRN